MGYRSQVKIIFYSNKPEEYPMVKLWVEQNYAPPKQYGFELEEFEIGGHKCIGYEASNVKWYEAYDDVAAIEDLRVKFEEAFGPENTPLISACYEFIRIGEVTTDIDEIRWNNYGYLLSIARYICES